MVNGSGFVLNGLKGAELIVYNVLRYTDTELSGAQIAHLTTYHPNTVYRALRNLRQMDLIELRRKSRGQKYDFSVKKG